MSDTQIVYVTEHGSRATIGYDKVKELEAKGYQIVAEREDARWVADGVHCNTRQYTLRKD
jgi:hypothetical protein